CQTRPGWWQHWQTGLFLPSADVQLDEFTLMAGLLHDVVEDTQVSLGEVRTRFGEDVADLVDGVTKLGKLEYRSEATKQAENFQKFILATTNDIRVLLVKLADRLHNMRTLHHLPNPDKRKRIAMETMDIYAPLARRVGLYHVASELEDRSFREINPGARDTMISRLEELAYDNATDLERIRGDIDALMDAGEVSCRIKGRRKQPYSIWRKLERKDISFRDVADIFAFRIIVGSVEDCYRVFALVHTTWKCLPERFRDHISVPKPNGYRSLHTTVRASGNRRVELQIRTEDMDRTAEYGVAAHWSYKDSQYGFDAEGAREVGLDPAASLRAFSALIADASDPNEFLEHAKLEMYRENVFAFTPKGRLIILPKGAMPLDFAYQVHTEVGDRTVGVRINNEPRSLRTVLKNGDVVEIVKGETAKPVVGWEALITTGRAKGALRRLDRDVKARDFKTYGRAMLNQALRRAGIDPVVLDLERVTGRTEYPSVDALYEALGSGAVSPETVLETAFPDAKKADTADKLHLDSQHAPLLVAGEHLTPGITLHLGTCCRPIPGDRIIGIRVPGQGIVVHAISCAKLEDYDDTPASWVDLQWTDLARTGAVASTMLRVRAAHQRGVLAALCNAVAQADGNIVSVSTDRIDGAFVDLLFEIEVEDLRRLSHILAALRALAVVDSAAREQIGE
ncbi:MAG: RelA/SpoT family protein, partial [Pseudomonadota bacterium]